MIINNPTTITQLYQSKTNAVVPVATSTGSTVTDNTATDTVTISHAGKNSAEKFQEISGRYDVSNMSVNERSAMAKELYDSKLISTTEYMNMTIPYCCADLTEDIEAVNSERRDFLSLAKYNYELNESSNTAEANAMAKRTIDIYEQIKAQRKS
ncbi:MAG: hypothetical protein JKY14_04550 [Paraglaciecola sp.]|nr:hypothetical protein [Paraglaciecola sp.]